MHPLDSSLDASLHGHEHTARKARRRCSLDNGYLASADLRNSLGVSNHYNASSYHNFGSPNQHQRGPRRLSLNNCTAMNTTFLATSTNYTVSTADKCDLDMDYHSWMDENNHSCSKSSYHSTRSRVNSLDVISKNQAATAALVSDAEPDFNDESENCDSFCEATGAEPANQEYMMQDLGASCFWNDVVFSDHHIDDYSDDEDEVNNHDCHGKPMTVAGEKTSETSPVSGHTELTEADTILPVLRDDSVGDAFEADDEERHVSDGVDDDSFSECDSFCDAQDNERANAEYLKKDLGASCFWASSDDLILDALDGPCHPHEHTLNASIRTISEEV